MPIQVASIEDLAALEARVTLLEKPAAPLPPKTVQPAGATVEYVPTFADEFTDLSLDYNKATELGRWRTVDAWGNRTLNGNGERQMYRAFLAGHFAEERARYERLAQAGQKPEIMVVGCVDSRVSPEAIFNAAPGELLVARNVANLVPRYQPDGMQHGTSAALEFAVQALRVKHIVVLGHAYCGGIRAFADEAEPLSPGDFIGRWMAQIAPAAEGLGPRGEDADAYLRQLEFASVELSLRNLMSFPCISTLVERGKLRLHGAYFGVATGRLLVRDATSGKFEPIAGTGGAGQIPGIDSVSR